MIEQNATQPVDQNGNPLPAQGAAPGTPAPPPQGILAGTGGLADAVAAAYMKHLTQNQPPPVSAVVQKAQAAADAAQPVHETPQEPSPGSFQDKLGGAMSDLGDAAHAGDTKGGWLSGVVNTVNARNQRLAQQQKDQALLAKTQAETVALHRNLYQQDATIRQEAYKGNQSFVDTFKVNHDVEEGLSHDQLMKRAQSDKNFAQNYYVRATGDEPVLDGDGVPKKDKDGNPITTPTYAVISRATKDGQKDDKVVTADMSGAMRKYLGSNIPVNTKLTVDQYAALDTAVNSTRNAVNIINSTNGKELSDDQMKSLQPYLTDPTIQGAISHVPGSAYAGVQQYLQNADAHIAQLGKQADDAKAQNNQKAYDAANQQIAAIQSERGKVSAFASLAISPKQVEEFNKQKFDNAGTVGEFLKDPTKLQGHAESAMAAADDVIKTSQDPAVVAQAKRVKDLAQNVQTAERQNKIDTAVGEQTAKDNAAKIDNNPNGLSGEAFIKTLPVGRANMVRALAEGRLPVNPSAFERSAAGKPNQLADDVFAAFPDFNATLGAEWPKAWAQYMISGTDHKKAQAYNVALLHMTSLWDHTTGEGLYNPMSKAYQDRQIDINNFSREVGNALSTGVLTQAEHDEIVNALNSKLAITPEQKRERIAETAKLLAGKINTQQQQFEQVSPSASIKVPSLLLPESKKSLEYVLKGGQQVDKNAGGKATDVQRPKDLAKATGAAPAANGKMYWHDAAGNPLREVKPGELPND
jgi:hypothetical protein